MHNAILCNTYLSLSLSLSKRETLWKGAGSRVYYLQHKVVEKLEKHEVVQHCVIFCFWSREVEAESEQSAMYIFEKE